MASTTSRCFEWAIARNPVLAAHSWLPFGWTLLELNRPVRHRVFRNGSRRIPLRSRSFSRQKLFLRHDAPAQTTTAGDAYVAGSWMDEITIFDR